MKNIIIFLLLFSAVKSSAYPTDALLLPNNATLDAHHWRFDGRSFFNIDKRYSDTTPTAPTASLGATYGVFDNEELSVETGLDWFEPVAQDNLNALRAHTKFAVSEHASIVGVAIGIFDYALKTNADGPNIIYLQLEKKLQPLGNLRAGYFVGCPDVLIDENRNIANKGFMAGWDRKIKEISDTFSLSAEWLGGQSIKGGTVLGTLWNFEKAAIKLGYFIPNNRHLMRDSILTQLSFEL
jgi:hypothetical protein